VNIFIFVVYNKENIV